MAERAMPSFSKSPPELVERFATVLDRYPDAAAQADVRLPGGVRRRQHGDRACSRDHWVVRLPEAEIDAAKAAGADAFEPMPGKPMKAFVVIPRGRRGRRREDRGAGSSGAWRHAAAMPAKK